jgi:hypothetical protein
MLFAGKIIFARHVTNIPAIGQRLSCLSHNQRHLKARGNIIPNLFKGTTIASSAKTVIELLNEISRRLVINGIRSATVARAKYTRKAATMNDLVHETNAPPRQYQWDKRINKRAQQVDGTKFQEGRDAPGHMGLISENHPGMMAEMPACSAAAASGATSTASLPLLAAASASIPQRRGG